jgi:hypothetical protein
MKSFVLIDLNSQAEAAWLYWKDWTKQDILTWLAKHGTIALHTTHSDSYFFQSTTGIDTSFILTDNGEFYIYWGEHVFHRVDNSR